jgi:hypothetical protein
MRVEHGIDAQMFADPAEAMRWLTEAGARAGSSGERPG